MQKKINVGRATSGGVFFGLLGNPVRENIVSPQYETHIRSVLQKNASVVAYLKTEMKAGAVLFCPGCGIGSPTCHARVIERVLNEF